MNQAYISQTMEETIVIKRVDLEKEHSLLLARVQQIRQLLGWEPLPSARQQRKLNRMENYTDARIDLASV